MGRSQTLDTKQKNKMGIKGLLLGIFFGLANLASGQSPTYPPCVAGVGERLFATGDDIQIEFIKGEGNPERFSDVYLYAGDRQFFYCGSSGSYGTSTNFGKLVAGEELRFSIYSAGINFVTGPSERNEDGLAHAKIFCETNGSMLVGFEDSYGVVGLNYDDVLFRVTRVPARPSIVIPPTNQVADVGQNATLSAVVSGTLPLSYQWYKGEALIAGATSSILTLANIQQTDQGAYTVLVSNVLGQVSSGPVELVVNYRPAANAGVGQQIISANGVDALVALDGSGSGDADNDALRYAWFESGSTNALALTKTAILTKPVGKHDFSLVVSDDRLSNTNVVSVTVVTVAGALQDLLARVNQKKRARTVELRVILQSAITLAKRGNVVGAKKQLEAFQAMVRRQIQPSDGALAAELIEGAQNILGALSAPETQLMANAISPFQIELAWTDGSAYEEGFKIERSTDGVHFTQIAQVLPNTTRYRDSGLFPESARYYRVRPFLGKLNGAYSNVRTGVTPGSACKMSLIEWNYDWLGDTPKLPAGLGEVVSVAAGASATGGSHALALRRDGTVVS